MKRTLATGSLLALLLLATGCRSPLWQDGGLYRHRELGYAIAAPAVPASYWRREKLADTDLGFRGMGGETLSLATRCGGPLAPPRILARHLRLALADHELEREAEVMVDGQAAWMQVLKVRDEAGSVEVKTVTLVLRECVFDFVLAARSRFAEAERSFDAWVGTFRAGDALLGGGAP